MPNTDEVEGAMARFNKRAIEQDWRFAELIARAWMEPGLIDRYAADPCAVLAEFGLTVADPQDAPDLAPYCGPDLIIEDLEHARGYRMTGTGGFCTTSGDTDEEPVPAPAPKADPAYVRRRHA